MTNGDGQLGPDLTGDPENDDVERVTRLLARLHGDDEADGGTPAGGGQPGDDAGVAPADGDGFLDDAIADFDRTAAIEAGLFKRGYSVVVREEPCGKDACACTDDRDARHGSTRYHVHTRADGSRRWEYIGPAYDV